MKQQYIALIFIGIAVVYGLQLFLTAWQAKRFYKRLRELRKDGLAVIGNGGGKWAGRAFAVLIINPDEKIVHAEVMSGMTVFEKLKPVPALINQSVREISEISIAGLKKKENEAFQSAAQEYLKKAETLKSEDFFPAKLQTKKNEEGMQVSGESEIQTKEASLTKHLHPKVYRSKVKKTGGSL